MKTTPWVIPGSSQAKLACVFSATLLISACGGSGGSDSNNASDTNNLVIGGITGGDASALTDDEILLAAVNSSDEGLNTNLINLRSLSEQEQGDTGTIFGTVITEEDTQSVDSLDVNSSIFLQNSMGIDATGAMQAGVITSREGNAVTVRPSADVLCANEVPLAAGLNDNLETCRELVNDLTVEVQALSTETGLVTYFFDSAPVLLVGYSPQGVSYELKLVGMFDVVERSATLNNEPFDTDLRLSGAFRLAATIRNAQEGSEAGTLALEVSEPISSNMNDDGESFSLQNSTVFEIDFDQATGDASMTIDWGALQIIDGTLDENDNTVSQSVRLDGLTAVLDINDSESGFVLSNIGIGNGLTLTIGDAEAARLNFQQFGITQDENGVVTIDGALNASYVANNMSGWIGEYANNYSYQADLSAAQGTTVSEVAEGIYTIDSGQVTSGVLATGENISGVSVNEQSTVTVLANECVQSAVDENTEQPIVVVDCP